MNIETSVKVNPYGRSAAPILALSQYRCGFTVSAFNLACCFIEVIEIMLVLFLFSFQ